MTVNGSLMNRIRKSRFLIMAAISTLLFVYFTIIPMSQAYASDAFSTGTVILGLPPTTAMFTVSGMAPGDIQYGGLEVSNSGSLQLRYDMSTTADDASILDERLDLTVDVVTGAGVDTIWYTADDVVGTANVYGPDGALSSAALLDRVLSSWGSERLRFKVTLPLSTDNGYQNTSCTVSFVFDAEQTANNP